MEARTAGVYTGLCFANGEANRAGDLAVFGWTVQEGAWQGQRHARGRRGLLEDVARVYARPISFPLRDNNLHTAPAHGCVS